MKSRTSPFLVNLSFAFAILILAAIIAFAGFSLRGLIESNEMVGHTLVVLDKLDEALAHISDAESGTRGYVITGDESFIEPYQAALDPQEGVNAQLAELRELTADNPSQQERLDRLEGLVNNKMAILSQNIELRQREGFEAAQELVTSGKGKEDMDSIRALIKEMHEAEFALLQTRSDAASTSLQNILWASAVGVPTTLALMAASFFLLWRQIRERRRAEEDLRHLNAELDRRVTERMSELAESERNFRDLADSALVGIYRTTLQGKILYLNGTLARMMGFDSPEETIRDGSLARYRDPADRQAFLEKLQRDGVVESTELVLLNQFGEPLTALVSAKIEGDQLIGTFLDITERKRAEEQIARLAIHNKLVLESVGEGIYGLDTNGVITFINPAAARFFGEPRENLIGVHGHNHHHHTRADGTPYPREECPIYAAFHDGETHRVEDEIFWRADGTSFPVEYTSTPVRNENGEIAGAVVVFKDITERKQAELRVQHLTRLYVTLSQINQMIVRVNERDELFQSICRLAVDYGKFALAWIGLVDRETGAVTPVTVHGASQDRLPFQTINYKEPLFKDGLIGEAIRTGKVVYSRDIQTDPTMRHWRDLTVVADFRAAAAIPFRLGGEIVGFLKLYATDVDSFADKEQHSLLDEMALDISYALDGMEREQKKTETEEALRESEARYRLLFDSMLSGFALHEIICDEAGKPVDYRFLEVNPAFEKLTGLRAADLVGRTVMEVLPGIEPEWIKRYGVVALTGEPTTFENYSQELGRYYQVTAFCPKHGRFAVIFEDVTERNRAEENRLARQVAERASQAKTEFLSRMSHEFRTPLNAIMGFAQLLKMDKLEASQERGADQIYKSGRHLLDLVNEVLDIARIESGRMTVSPEPVRVADAVNEVFDLIRPMAEARRLSLTLKIPSSTDVFVEADRQRFKQVLLNLLSNAVKYNREGGAIDVIASLTISGYLRLQVRDSGDGIPPEKMERLFVPFDRLDTDASEGTGLGLALSKGLVETMGGRIGVESKVGEGTIFWLELKLVTERLKEIIMAEVEENLTEKIRKGRGVVLYVEDNLANINLVEAIMDRLPGVKLITAMQGRLAMDLAKEHQPDLILLDLHLPDIHGSDVLRWLKAEPATQNIPVVVISADAMPTHVDKLLSQGAQTYLTKPIDVKEFLKVIEEHI